jgi:hypothetical protein
MLLLTFAAIFLAVAPAVASAGPSIIGRVGF